MHTDVVKTKPTKLSVYTTLFVQMFFGNISMVKVLEIFHCFLSELQEGNLQSSD